MRAPRIVCALLLLVASPCLLAQMKIVSEGKATQIRTDELVIHSERIGRDFLVEVTLLEQVQPGRKYAAVYALDGGFGVAGPASRFLIAGTRTVPFYVVSIGYPNVMGRYLGPRNTDLAHRRVKVDGREIGGGGAAFEDFVLKDLRPYLEQRYPLDPARAVLFGHSGGGLFAATVLVTNPSAFSGYVIGGLPLIYDSPLPQQAKAIAPRGNGQRVYLGLAPSDAINLNSDQFAAPLSGPDSKFKVHQEIYQEESHNSEYLQLIARGLPFVLPTQTAELVAIPVKPELLERHVGKYRTDQMRLITITRRDKTLVGQLDSGSQVPLEAESDMRFFSRSANSIVTFDPAVATSSSQAKTPSLTLHFADNDIVAKRVE